jgi:hypothetical protein
VIRRQSHCSGFLSHANPTISARITNRNPNRFDWEDKTRGAVNRADRMDTMRSRPPVQDKIVPTYFRTAHLAGGHI